MPHNTSENNKRIAKNTTLLYIRMILIMGVTLYTSRVVINMLGVEDYGIFNVVGGIIATLGFLSGSLNNASSRFVTNALGKGNNNLLKEIFSTVLTIHYILAAIILILGETVGLWFVIHELQIPLERQTAALWVYNCSIITAIISVISVPYDSLIIAHEKMEAFAYISLFEVTAKLLIVYLLNCFLIDKLILYAVLYLMVQVIIRFTYTIYCSKNFKEAQCKPTLKIRTIRQIFVYAGWTMNGYLAVIGYTQGINILLNIFFGPVVNAARGIAEQVQSAVTKFVSSFQMAIRPQIIKSYAGGDLEYMHKLVIASSKYGYYLILIIEFPILLSIDSILNFWLGIVPDYTVSFVRIMLFSTLLQPLNMGMAAAIHASGDIKKFQLFEGTTLLMIIPVAYILLKFYHISPEQVMLVYLVISYITQCVRVWVVVPKIEMKYMQYIMSVIIPIIMPTLCFLLPLYVVRFASDFSALYIVICSVVGCVYIMGCIYILGLNVIERQTVLQFIKSRLRNLT